MPDISQHFSSYIAPFHFNKYNLGHYWYRGLDSVIENRKLTRYSARLKVYAHDTGELLGYADNISIRGMHLLSKDRLPDRQEIRIWFGGADANDEDDKISLTAFKVWGGFNDTVPRMYSSGLYFEAPSEQVLDKIQDLLLTLNEQTVRRFSA